MGQRTRRGRGGRLIVALAILVGVWGIPATGGAFSGEVRNSTNTAGTAQHFTCANAYLTDFPRYAFALDSVTGTTSARDFSPWISNGTYHGNFSFGSTTPMACPRDFPARSYVLDGKTSYMTSALRHRTPQIFTIETWFKTSDASGTLISLGRADTGASAQVMVALYIDSNSRLEFGVFYSSYVTIASTSSVVDGKWHHVAASFNNGKLTLFVDGIPEATTTTTGTVFPQAGRWRLGYDSTDAYPNRSEIDYFRGELRFSALYLTELTPARIAQHHAAGR